MLASPARHHTPHIAPRHKYGLPPQIILFTLFSSNATRAPWFYGLIFDLRHALSLTASICFSSHYFKYCWCYLSFTLWEIIDVNNTISRLRREMMISYNAGAVMPHTYLCRRVVIQKRAWWRFRYFTFFTILCISPYDIHAIVIYARRMLADTWRVAHYFVLLLIKKVSRYIWILV